MCNDWYESLLSLAIVMRASFPNNSRQSEQRELWGLIDVLTSHLVHMETQAQPSQYHRYRPPVSTVSLRAEEIARFIIFPVELENPESRASCSKSLQSCLSEGLQYDDAYTEGEVRIENDVSS